MKNGSKLGYIGLSFLMLNALCPLPIPDAESHAGVDFKCIRMYLSKL